MALYSTIVLSIGLSMFGSRERLYNGWVRDHYRFLFRSAWALTGSRTVAEDVVQDCFELAWRHMDQLRDRTLARPWLFQILRREAYRNLAPPTDPPLESYDESADGRAGADALATVEQRMDILVAMRALPAIHREVLTLFYFEDMPVAEMALALDVAPGTVLSRLNRARDALRQRMQPVTAGTEAMGRVLDFPNPATRGRHHD
ncbi:MAG: RNA polymerase sigma factor [Burkholderiales bacterium]